TTAAAPATAALGDQDLVRTATGNAPASPRKRGPDEERQEASRDKEDEDDDTQAAAGSCWHDARYLAMLADRCHGSLSDPRRGKRHARHVDS
ncbi:MAG TPA: hypothetical protein VFE48_08665, partial [Methylomirabilota bacterium]|nr:hypothetical protein [Methylomirabilota bacterium]